MKEKDVQVNFRMPAKLKAELEAAATAEKRSLTAEVVQRLSKSFVGYFGGDPVTDERTLDTVLHPAIGKGPASTPEEVLRRVIALQNGLAVLQHQLKLFSPAELAAAMSEMAATAPLTQAKSKKKSKRKSGPVISDR